MNRGSLKRFAAIGLAAVMTLTMSTVARAEGSSGTTGTGSSTGHVNKKIINVVFPTIAETGGNSEYFNFVMDAEGHIKETGKYKANAVTLPESGDTGVYFATATSGTFANTSQALDVTNKSSHPIEVSATAMASVGEGDTMIALVESAEDLEDATVPSLYLGIKVDNGIDDPDEKAISTEGATAKATIAGYADNFEVNSKADGTYEFVLVEEPDNDEWKKASISMTGAVKAVDDVGDVVAPSVAVTWSYVDPDASVAMTDFNWSSTGQYFYFAIPGVDQVDMTKVTSLKAKQGAVVNDATSSAQKSSSGGYITVTWTAIKQGLTWPNADNPDAEIDFEVTYDGVVYTATYGYTAP